MSGMVISANFTAEPVGRILAFWLEELGLGWSVEFAPYNQVFQQLLDPTSVVAANRQGANTILVRFEEWAGREGQAGAPADEFLGAVARNFDDFVAALREAADRSPVPHVVCVCPASRAVRDDRERAVALDRLEDTLRRTFAGESKVLVLGERDLPESFRVDDYDDPHSNRLGHVPYTPEFFAALGTLLARTAHVLSSPPYKVVTLDCDQTLWKGVCGEVGAQGIEIDPARRALQEFMVEQHRAGMLLCLCSKNNEPDVFEVFDTRADLPLGRDHIVSWRINWRPKSQNLRELADELQLGLDSFVFVDDDPAVCAEVRAHCPEVLTLHLPADEGQIPRFLANAWAFDRLRVTHEDTARTALYKQNVERRRLEQRSLNYEDFLASLGLEIDIAPMEPDHLPRVSQLTLRTNQFNATTVRRSESEIQALLRDEGYECFVVEVRDRFGDYGLVGVLVYTSCPEDDAVVADTFLLSCRALGRGVEHRMLARLGALAEERGLGFVDVRFVRTEKNKPALEFFEASDASRDETGPERCSFRFSARTAAAAAFDPRGSSDADSSEGRDRAERPEGRDQYAGGRVAALVRAASELTDPARVLEAVEAKRRPEALRRAPYVAPRGPIELQLVTIWEDLFKGMTVGVKDNFFDLGGDSLMAVQLFSQIEASTESELSIATLLQAPTIEELGDVLRAGGGGQGWSSLVPIQPLGSRPPFYCAHAAGGTVLYYRDLALRLGADQPTYGLQAVGLDQKRFAHDRVEDMAEHYVNEICAFQPEGPYYLGGSSFGGLIAYEMARQLRARGEDVALLALFDTYCKGYPKLLPTTSGLRHEVYKLLGRIRHHADDLHVLSMRERISYVAEKGLKARKQLKRATWKRKNALRRTFYEATGKDLPKNLQRTQNAITKALEAYDPPTYDGPVTLFRAKQQPYGIVPDPTLGWGRVAVGGLELLEVPGSHGAVVVEPHARFLAEQLSPCLQAARARSANGRQTVAAHASAAR